MTDPATERRWRDAIRRPTFWVMAVLVALFVYQQWPTRPAPVDTPDFHTQTLPAGAQLTWEAEPEQSADTDDSLWHLSRRGLEFLAQTGPLEQPLTELAEDMLAVDRDQVDGRVHQSLRVDGDRARYALIDSENRVQLHAIHALGERWLKVSVLYRPNRPEEAERAHRFLDSVVPGDAIPTD